MDGPNNSDSLRQISAANVLLRVWLLSLEAADRRPRMDSRGKQFEMVFTATGQAEHYKAMMREDAAATGGRSQDGVVV